MKRLKDFVERKFRYDVDMALFVACCMLVCLLVYGIITTIFPNYDIGGKSPLEGKYEVVQYLHDDNIFSNQEELIQGLEYLREKTNIQMIIIASSDKWSDGAAVRKYYLTVEDEGHILLVVPPEGSTNQFRYAIGNKANQVIDSKAMQYLLSQVRNSRDGKYWKTKICEFADKLIS